jgi:hypothetical protein
VSDCLAALGAPRQGEAVQLGRGLPAGLQRVPIDAYAGTPLRMALISGQPVIYSVGRDGDDDGGLKDADFGRNPDGDLLFRLPKLAGRSG